jgi:hypothetical protein
VFLLRPTFAAERAAGVLFNFTENKVCNFAKTVLWSVYVSLGAMCVGG